MKLTFLGSGSAFTIGDVNYHSNMVLETDNSQRLLIDCGSDIRLSLAKSGLSYKEIDAVYISHLHADHAGGLEWLAFNTYFDPDCLKPTLYIHQSLVNDLWNKVLAGSMSSLPETVATLSSYYHVQPIADNDAFIWQGVPFRLVQTLHVVAGFSFMPSYGLWFTLNDKTIFITTDTQFAPYQIRDFYEQADFIFQDCETALRKSGVHAHYSELVTLKAAIKKKMWLYHYNPGDLPDARQDGFAGFVQRGQCFDFGIKK